MKYFVLLVTIGVGRCTDNTGLWSYQDVKSNNQLKNFGYQGNYDEQYYNQYGNLQGDFGRKGVDNEKRGNLGIYKKKNDDQYDKYSGPKDYIISFDDRVKNPFESYKSDCDGNSKECLGRDGKKDEDLGDKKIDGGRNRDYYNDQDWYDNEDRYNNVNVVGLGQNDTEDIVRPCALEDWQCIRQFLARNSKCKPAYGPIPDPLYVRRNTVYLPNLNVTVIITRLKVEGLSSIKISEFYVNRDTGNLVVALNFQNIKETSPKTYFRFQRRAKESIVGSDFAAVEFRSGTFTAVIPKVPYLRLDLAEVHADIDDPRPPLIFGPGAVNSTDPAVATSLARVLVDLPTSVQEGFLFQSQFFTAIYIQEYLCDFGLKIISI